MRHFTSSIVLEWKHSVSNLPKNDKVSSDVGLPSTVILNESFGFQTFRNIKKITLSFKWWFSKWEVYLIIFNSYIYFEL